MIQHHPKTAGSKKHTEGWCWAMFVGASKSVDGVSSRSNLLYGKVWSKTLNTQSLTLFSCEQNFVKEVLHYVGPI